MCVVPSSVQRSLHTCEPLVGFAYLWLMEIERSGCSDRQDDIASQESDDHDNKAFSSHRASNDTASPQLKDSMHAAFDANIRPKLDAIDTGTTSLA